MEKPIILARNIHKTFRNGKIEVHALRGVDLAIAAQILHAASFPAEVALKAAPVLVALWDTFVGADAIVVCCAPRLARPSVGGNGPFRGRVRQRRRPAFVKLVGPPRRLGAVPIE